MAVRLVGEWADSRVRPSAAERVVSMVCQLVYSKVGTMASQLVDQ